MKYSICSCIYDSIGTLLPCYSLEDTMRRLARIGYDAIEIVCAAPLAYPYYMNQTQRKQVNVWKKQYGIAVSSVMAQPGGGPGCNVAAINPIERAWAIQYIKDVIDLAYLWDCKRLAFVAGWYSFGTRRIDAWNNTLDTLKQVAAYALERGIDVCIEPTSSDSNIVDCPDDALLMMEQSGMPNVGIMFDTAHAIFRQEDPADYVYTAGKNLKHIHLTDDNRMPPGTDGYDYYPVMQALKDVGFDGYVTFETGFPRSCGADSAARQALLHLKEIEAKLV